MPRTIEEPATVQRNSARSETVTTHPAFCQIRASRVSGNTALYDSDFRHNHFMNIEISRSELHRSLNRDWHYAGETMMQIAMTESQWATFVSSLNFGGGVPCTLEYLNHQPVPGLPDPKPRTDQFKAEMQKCLDDVVRRIDALMESAKTKAQREELRMLRQEVVSNLPFVASQFEEHMETTVEAAKQEVHGYMNTVISRAGISALKGDTPLQIQGGK